MAPWLTAVWLGKRVTVGWERWLLALFGVAAVALTVVSADETRVFALVTWPAVLWLCLRAVEVVPADLLRRVTAVTVVAATVVPRVWVEGGVALTSRWAHF